MLNSILKVKNLSVDLLKLYITFIVFFDVFFMIYAICAGALLKKCVYCCRFCYNCNLNINIYLHYNKYNTKNTNNAIIN